MDQYDNARVIINKQTFEFEYVKDLVGMLMGGSMGLVTGHMINSGLDMITGVNKCYNITLSDGKVYASDNTKIYVHNPNYIYNSDYLTTTYENERKKLETFNSAPAEIISSLATGKLEFSDTLIIIEKYLAYKITKNLPDDNAMLVAKAMYLKDYNGDYKDVFSDAEQASYQRLLAAAYQQELAAAQQQTSKKSPENTSGLYTQANYQIVIEYILNNNQASTDISDTDTLIQLKTVNDLKTCYPSKKTTSTSNAQKDTQKNTTVNAYRAAVIEQLQKSQTPKNPNTKQKLEITPINIEQAYPVLSPTIRSFGIYAITIGYGAIIGAKYIGELIK